MTLAADKNCRIRDVFCALIFGATVGRNAFVMQGIDTASTARAL